MLTRTTAILAAALIAGAASAAQANDHEDQSGGFRTGPMGQVLAPRSATQRWLHNQKYGFARRHDYGFAYMPGRPRAWSYERDWW
jgi:hypothetical protein